MLEWLNEWNRLPLSVDTPFSWEYTANRAAEWELGKAADACMKIANECSQQAAASKERRECLHLLSKQAAAMDCYNAMRAMMKGGESDGQ
jgi:hypothetical protein